jgi:hypothetical protein
MRSSMLSGYSVPLLTYYSILISRHTPNYTRREVKFLLTEQIGLPKVDTR